MALLSKSDKKIFVLLDPDNLSCYSDSFFLNLRKSKVSALLVGGSLLQVSIEAFIKTIRSKTNLPIWLFPGSSDQFTEAADGLLLLSLTSGRNPQFLIGEHVKSAFRIAKSDVEVLSTGYILIDGGNETSVSYMSSTKPIPADKHGIALSTALASQLLGHHLIYLEAGSGALHPVDPTLIKTVAKGCSLPIIVGGGLRTKEDIEAALQAGANAVVIGSAIEKDPDFIKELNHLTIG